MCFQVIYMNICAYEVAVLHNQSYCNYQKSTCTFSFESESWSIHVLTNNISSCILHVYSVLLKFCSMQCIIWIFHFFRSWLYSSGKPVLHTNTNGYVWCGYSLATVYVCMYVCMYKINHSHSTTIAHSAIHHTFWSEVGLIGLKWCSIHNM